jgi:hypothetical protein
MVLHRPPASTEDRQSRSLILRPVKQLHQRTIRQDTRNNRVGSRSYYPLFFFFSCSLHAQIVRTIVASPETVGRSVSKRNAVGTRARSNSQHSAVAIQS